MLATSHGETLSDIKLENIVAYNKPQYTALYFRCGRVPPENNNLVIYRIFGPFTAGYNGLPTARCQINANSIIGYQLTQNIRPYPKHLRPSISGQVLV